MVSRIWHGWTSHSNADAYEDLLRTEVLPGIADKQIPGYNGAHLLRRELESEVEFITLLWFESIDSVRDFIGDDYEVAYVPLEEMSNIEGFDEEIAEELRARAKDALLTAAIASEEKLGANEPAEDLLGMDGMDRHLADILASRGIITMEDLAEQGVDELLDIEDMTEERAGELIMTARAPWFAEAEAAEAEAAATAEAEQQ